MLCTLAPNCDYSSVKKNMIKSTFKIAAKREKISRMFQCSPHIEGFNIYLDLNSIPQIRKFQLSQTSVTGPEHRSSRSFIFFCEESHTDCFLRRVKTSVDHGATVNEYLKNRVIPPRTNVQVPVLSSPLVSVVVNKVCGAVSRELLINRDESGLKSDGRWISKVSVCGKNVITVDFS
jgi:hypothetical protein